MLAVLALAYLLSSAAVAGPFDGECSLWNVSSVPAAVSSPQYELYDLTSSTVEAGINNASLLLPYKFVLLYLQCLLSEYIVTFKGYYSQQAREHFLTAALRGCCEDGSWRIVPRQNPGRNFPSDFSLIELRMPNISICLASLTLHPLVRSITPHRKLSHTLRCSDKKSFGHSRSRMALQSVC